METSSGDCFIAKILVLFSIDSEMVREPAPFVPHLVASEDHKTCLRDHPVETSSGDCLIAKILVLFSINSEMVREPAPFVPHLVTTRHAFGITRWKPVLVIA